MQTKVHTPFAVLVLMCLGVCGCTGAARTRVTAQTPPVATKSTETDRQIAETNEHGSSEKPVCTAIYVTEDSCKAKDLGFWARLKCNSGAISAIASCLSAVTALVIGIFAFQLNKNIRRGQVAHEQMKMLLEIDGELIDRPELWAVHGTKYIPEPTPSEDLNAMISEAERATPEKQAAAARAISIALSEHPGAPPDGRTSQARIHHTLPKFLRHFICQLQRSEP